MASARSLTGCEWLLVNCVDVGSRRHPGTDTRPTTDKVREATFNALGSLDLVRDAVVADLYAG